MYFFSIPGVYTYYVIANHVLLNIDNRHIVPYNPALLLKYKAHINVEICSTISAVKYLYKYCYKGHDRAMFSMRYENNGQVQEADEIKLYQEARYISASEAIWRLLAFPIHGRDPAVERLPVHLENHQIVYYNPNDPQRALDASRNTKLTKYFDAVREEKANPLSAELLNGHPPAYELLYHEFPKYYTWAKKEEEEKKVGDDGKAEHYWKRRAYGKRSDKVGRMYNVHPSDVERFCLRLLLASIRGVESYEFLRTFDGRVYATYKEVCLARGLLESDAEYHKVMEEATFFRCAKQLRNLLATLLFFVTLLLRKRFTKHSKILFVKTIVTVFVILD
jgi:hypothetical protein